MRVLIRVLGAVVVAGAIAAPTAATAGDDAKPSRRFCSQYLEYNVLIETVSRARSLLGEAFEDEGDDTEAFAVVALSAPLGDVTAKMARSAPRSPRDGFRATADAYRGGATVLEDAGLTPDQIAELPGDVTDTTQIVAGQPTPQLDEIMADLGIADPAAFFSAGREVVDAVDEAQLTAFGALPDDVDEQCGIAPSDDFECDELLDLDTVADVLGSIDETESTRGCEWTGNDEIVSVAVFKSAAAFDLLSARLFEPKDVTGVGDEGAAGSGYTSETSGGTSGMTLVVREGRRTVRVSASLDDTTPEQLTGLAQQVLENL